MPTLLVEGRLIKVACHSCIKGHRSKTCKHWDRVLIEVRKPGRPQSECQHAGGDCKCMSRTAYYVPGHQPRFAPATAPRTPSRDDAQVVVNALEHRLPDNAIEVKVEKDDVENTTEVAGKTVSDSGLSIAATPSSHGSEKDYVATTNSLHPWKMKEKLQNWDTHSSTISDEASKRKEPESSLTEPKKAGCCNCGHDAEDFTEMDNALGIPQDDIYEPTTVPNLHNTQTESTHQTTRSHSFIPPSLGFASNQHTTPGGSQQQWNPFPAPHTQCQQTKALLESSQWPPQQFQSNRHNSTIATISQEHPHLHNTSPWQIFPVFDPAIQSSQDQCSCTDEAHCLCAGCLDHPRNPATMQMVLDALEFQATDGERDQSRDFFGDAIDTLDPSLLSWVDFSQAAVPTSFSETYPVPMASPEQSAQPNSEGAATAGQIGTVNGRTTRGEYWPPDYPDYLTLGTS